MGKAATFLFYLYLPFHFVLFYIIDENISSSFAGLMNRYVFVTYISMLMIEQLVNKSRIKFLEKNKFLIVTGKISFGLYCFHGMTITGGTIFLQKTGISISAWLSPLLIFIITYLIALASYYVYEMPFLKLKNRFSSI
jgi:peptidoglycan/LPS O-acetylase OafA/YrhL